MAMCPLYMPLQVLAHRCSSISYRLGIGCTQQQSKLIRKTPQKNMVILIDEVEAHLHPKWQRVIVPALLDVRQDLDPELRAQLLIATHSPLVTVSVSPTSTPLETSCSIWTWCSIIYSKGMLRVRNTIS